MFLLLINSCKKDPVVKENIDNEQFKKIQEYQKGAKIATISFEQFKSKAKIEALGNLKEIFLAPTASKGKLMSINTPETYEGFAIETDSIKVLSVNGRTSYIFPVKLSNSRAVTFQNLTIDEGPNGSLVFVNTYTPSKKWIADWRAGKAGKFEGDIGVSYLNNGQTTLSATGNVNAKAKIASVKTPDKFALVDGSNCNTTNYYFSLPYNCGSGQHGPGDSGCYLTGDDRAGIAQISFEITVCASGGGGGGGGGTTVTPPGNYNPCGGGSPPSPTPVSYNGVKGAKLMVHENPDCNPQPPILPSLPPPPLAREIKNNLTDPCLKATITEALATNKDVKGFLADLINKYAGQNNGIIINLSNGNIPKPAQTTWSFTNNTFTANIIFQNGYYNDVSKEAVIAALIHEVVHAHLLQTNNTYKNQPESAQHNYLFTHYVQDIGTYLINKYGMSHDDAYGLAWSGMGDIYNDAPSNKTFETTRAIPATATTPAIPAKTMTKTEIGGAVAPYKRIDLNPKGTPNCP